MKGCKFSCIWKLFSVIIIPVFGNIECEVSPEITYDVAPQSLSIVTCPSTTPYCMNVVNNLQNGVKKVTKRCAAESECSISWIFQAECLSFQQTSRYLFSFTCSYCCTTPKCNSELFPHQNSLYTGKFLPSSSSTTNTVPSTISTTGSNQTVKCHMCVGDNCFMDPSSHMCSPPNSFCMTHLEIHAAGPHLTKRCVNRTECKKTFIESSSPSSQCSIVFERPFDGLVCDYCCTTQDCPTQSVTT